MTFSTISGSYELVALLLFILSGFLFLLTLFLRMWGYFPPLSEKSTKRFPSIALTSSSILEDLHQSSTEQAQPPVGNPPSLGVDTLPSAGYNNEIAPQSTPSETPKVKEVVSAVESTSMEVTEDTPTGFLAPVEVTEDTPTGFLSDSQTTHNKGTHPITENVPLEVTEESFQVVKVLKVYTPES